MSRISLLQMRRTNFACPLCCVPVIWRATSPDGRSSSDVGRYAECSGCQEQYLLSPQSSAGPLFWLRGRSIEGAYYYVTPVGISIVEGLEPTKDMQV